MWEAVVFLVGLVVGFVVGALVYRNNKNKAEALLKQAEDKIKQAEAEAKALKEKVSKK